MDENRLIVNFLNQKTGGNYNPEAFELFKEFSKLERTGNKERFVLDFFGNKGMGNNVINDVNVFCDFYDYLNNPPKLKTFKVALLFICLNEPYWKYLAEVTDGIQKFFLPGHQTDLFLWSDLPMGDPNNETLKKFKQVFPTEPIEWPMGTLYRYHLFLQQEEKFKDYDYVMYLDADMRVVNYVGDEIIPKKGLFAAQHPMYALKPEYWPPYEPNPKSEAYIKRPGRIIQSRYGNPQLMPLYFAGGFQGGKTKKFLKAMKVMKQQIDNDLSKNYIAIWNDESHWNRYLFDNPPETILTPSYIYPDSLHKEYYFPLWGTEYPPKIITITKPESLKKLTPEEQARLYGKH